MLSFFERLIELKRPRARKGPTVISSNVAFPSATTSSLVDEITTEYWTSYNVTLHHQFESTEESLAYFHWRNDQYFKYIELMPVSGFDNQVVLDFGCGPGHDLVGFSIYSKPKQLIGIDTRTGKRQWSNPIKPPPQSFSVAFGANHVAAELHVVAQEAARRVTPRVRDRSRVVARTATRPGADFTQDRCNQDHRARQPDALRVDDGGDQLFL
jgi:hypothetical protein